MTDNKTVEPEVLPPEDQQNALVTIDRTTALEVFTTPGMIAPLLTSIADAAREFKGDISTAKGRAEIKSLAFKVTKTKTYIDGIGKELSDEKKAEIESTVAGLTAQRTAIESTRKEVKTFLDSLRDEVRQELDAWEAEQERIKKEKAAQEAAAAQRKADIQSAIDAYRSIPGDMIGQSSSAITSAIDRLAALPPTEAEFDDRAQEAQAAWNDCLTKLRAILDQAQTIERQQQEMRDREVAQQARDEERRKADERLRQEQLDRERAQRELEESKLREEQARKDSELRAQQAAEQAAAKERQRIADEQEAQRKADEARAANKAHNQKINREALDSLIISSGLTEEQAKAVIKAIITGKVSHVTIKY